MFVLWQKHQKNRTSKLEYVAQTQLQIVGFETPFSQKLNPTNRWVKLANKIPWDILVNVYNDQLKNKKTGADGINAEWLLEPLSSNNIVI